MMCDGEYNIPIIKCASPKYGTISNEELDKRINNAKQRIKRVDGKHGCIGCYLYTHYKDEHKECYYCNKPLQYPSIDCHKQFITFEYVIIDDPTVEPMNCPYPERWKHE